MSYEGGKMKRNRLMYDYEAYVLILPNVILYAAFILIPAIGTIGLSFTDFNIFQSNFVGLRNYTRLLDDARFLRSLGNTLYYTVGTIVPSLVLGLLIAVVLNNPVRGRAGFRMVIFLPHVLSVVAVSLAWMYLYNPSAGVFNQLLRQMGLPRFDWLRDPDMAMPSIIAMQIWNGLGYYMVVYLAGLQTIPDYLYEVADMDGASRPRKFFSITLPMLAATTFFLIVTGVIFSFQVFGQVYIMTRGGPLNRTTTIVHQIYYRGFEGYQMGYASAMAVFLLLLTVTVTLVNIRVGRGRGADDAA
ncbi:MAG: sugar ABC transporter permease [Spirochaetaceae bacterium]|nr:MAG: sugar ABC transporter permease [Spirochaetaceae bacterium]